MTIIFVPVQYNPNFRQVLSLTQLAPYIIEDFNNSKSLIDSFKKSQQKAIQEELSYFNFYGIITGTNSVQPYGLPFLTLEEAIKYNIVGVLENNYNIYKENEFISYGKKITDFKSFFNNLFKWTKNKYKFQIPAVFTRNIYLEKIQKIVHTKEIVSVTVYGNKTIAKRSQIQNLPLITNTFVVEERI